MGGKKKLYGGRKKKGKKREVVADDKLTELDNLWSLAVASQSPSEEKERKELSRIVKNWASSVERVNIYSSPLSCQSCLPCV